MKIAILTNFMEFQPGYSLTGIVKDQIRMLVEYGHDVHLFVNSKYDAKKQEAFNPKVTVHPVVPFCHLFDFGSKSTLIGKREEIGDKRPFADIIAKSIEVFTNELQDFDIAFTHDFVFIGWFLPYGQACKEASRNLPNLKWMHWIHSVPSGMRDYWNIQEFGSRHKLIYPNRTDALRVAEQFRGNLDHVRVIPHIKDLRTWFDFDEESCEFIKDYPAVMQADVVEVLPASVDRLEAKRVKEVILIFSKIKEMGRSVCLVIANQWATTTQHKQNVDGYKKIAARNGLRPNEEVIFTSDWKLNEQKTKGKYEVGLPKRILRDIMTCSNLFIFPTKEESFGLVLPEISLTSGCLLVLNKSLDMQIEVSGNSCLYFDFGSFSRTHNIENEGKYFNDIAMIILGRMALDEGIRTRTFMRQTYNYDNLYYMNYLPVIAESKMW